MSGVVFMICIPTKEYEKAVLQKIKKKVKIVKQTETFRYNVDSASNSHLSDEFVAPFESSPKAEKSFKNEFQTMEENLVGILEQHEITNSTWCKGNENNYVQVMFSLESTDRCEEILEMLKENEIGRRLNSVVSVIPCTVHFHSSHLKETDSKNIEESIHESPYEKCTAWNRFLTSVRSRLTVAQVVENVKLHAAFTFDFVCMLLISTMLCAIGLVENSNVCLLSSMLISPMMGPVMAGTFGSVIQDKRLRKTGVRNELIGLGIATVVGFCYGSVICVITDKYGMQDWPTYEMLSRGEVRSLWVNCLIALLSGAAVALGILSDNIASLVGVAISTSLMPPAVNAGLLWSMACVYYIKDDETTRYTSLTYTGYYFQNRGYELLALGAISICLTFINIVCIFVASIIVFKIKEVAPIASRDQARRQFWGHDIKVARDYNKSIGRDDVQLLYQSFYEEDQKYHDLYYSTDLPQNKPKHFMKRPEYTWSPCTSPTKRPTVKELNERQNKTKEYIMPSYNKHKSSHRRLSQIFASGTSETHKVKPPLLRSNSGQNKNLCTKTKRFTVTPSEYDPLKS